MIGESNALYEIRKCRVSKPILSGISQICSADKMCLALNIHGTLYQLTYQEEHNCYTKMKLTNIPQPVTSFSISETHCIALDKSGMIWVWGENS